MNQDKPKAIVTGASSGIGLATVKLLCEQGYEVEGIARDFSNTDCFSFKTHEIDLSILSSLPQKLNKFSTSPDLLVLNAGFGQFGGLEQFSHALIERLINTNLTSNVFLLKHFLPKMKQQGTGDIVLIGSESALQGAKAGAVYCATKFAIRGLAQSLRADCSTNNIRVMLVNPGPVSSDFFDTLNFSPQAGVDFVIEPLAVARSILHALNQDRNVVLDEINIQPIKRSFKKK